jgi:lipoyl(octanoyl) transferase
MQAHRRVLVIHDLGLVEYEDGLALQRAFAASRKGRAVPDTLLLLEHPPVLTLGRAARREHILAAREALEREGVAVFETDRGGDVTYHGPGQIVGYPVLDLAPERCDVRRYVGDLEEALIRTLAEFGIRADRIPGWTGVWVGQKGKDARKIAAIGVHISRWVTTHGFALNVDTDLSHFEMIVPCGIAEAGVTSMQRELGAAPDIKEVKSALSRNLAERCGAATALGRFDHRTISTSVIRRGPGGLEALLLRRHPHRGGFWQPVTGTIERGEQPAACAARELREETGLSTPVRALDYTHSFLFGEPRPDRAPRVFQETAFWTLAEGDPVIRLDPREHAEHAWLPVDEAMARVPFVGLRAALRRAVDAAR